MNDNVNHPSHYTDGKIEVIDYIEDKKLGYNLGNAIKYISRAGKKDPDKYVEDLEKAKWYLKREIETSSLSKETMITVEQLDRVGRFFESIVSETRYKPTRVYSSYQEDDLRDMLEHDIDVPDNSEFDITLTNGEEVTLQYGTDESGNRFLVFKDIYWKEQMNEDWTKDNYWRDADLRAKCNNEYFDLLPAWLRVYVKPVINVQVRNGERIETEDKLFPLSMPQVIDAETLRRRFGDDRMLERNPGDTQISLFKDPHNRVKMFTDEDGGTFADWWWLRSAYDYNYFNAVYNYGGYTNHTANYNVGVVLGFCI